MTTSGNNSTLPADLEQLLAQQTALEAQIAATRDAEAEKLKKEQEAADAALLEQQRNAAAAHAARLALYQAEAEDRARQARRLGLTLPASQPNDVPTDDDSHSAPSTDDPEATQEMSLTDSLVDASEPEVTWRHKLAARRAGQHTVTQLEPERKVGIVLFSLMVFAMVVLVLNVVASHAKDGALIHSGWLQFGLALLLAVWVGRRFWLKQDHTEATA